MNKIYLFKYGLAMLLMLCAFTTFAQTVFTGKVLDETNQPLPGATVRVKETGQSTVSDGNGTFRLSNITLPSITISVSFIGYDATETLLTQGKAATVQLRPSSRNLTDVVVVGYGTSRKSDLTGSISTVGSKDLNPGPITNPLQQLEGKAAGVDITQSGSEPGTTPTVRIRGITSLQGGNDPLVVVDGVQGNMDLFNQVPPSEIASVDILKDASATAIYGSRGAPGVIIVTTKKSAAGKTSVEYTENSSLDVIANKLKLLSADQWTQQAAAQGVDASANHGSNTDWFGLLTRNGYTQNHTLAFGGGTNSFNYRASVTAISQQGIVINSKFSNYIGRLTATQKALDDRLTLTLNLNSGTNDYTYSPTGVGNAAYTSNLISQAYVARPTDPVFNTNGTYYVDPNVFQYTNPYAVAQTVSNDNHINNLFGSLRADLELTKGLTAGWFGSWRKVDSNNGYYAPAASTITSAVSYNGQAHINNNHVDEKLMDINLTYKKDMGVNHFDATVVYEWQKQTYNGSYAAARGFINDFATYNALQLGTLANAQTGDVSSYKNDRGLVSFLGRVNYSYNNRYLITASFRRDGSTVFGVNNKWANFPSASLAWRVDQEDFMKNQHIFSSFKLRVGYGVTGNQQGIGPQNSIALVGLNPTSPTVYFGGSLIPNYSASQNANPDLKWETKKQANAGIDFGFLNDRLTGTVDVFTANTDNLLFNYTVPVQGPFLINYILANVGSLQNRGLELTLSYDVLKSSNTRLTLAGNGTLLKNKVLSLGGNIQGYNIPTNYVGLGSNAYLVVGKPVGVYRILQHQGKDANNAETVVDQNGNGTIELQDASPDRIEAGQSLPKYTYAFTPSFAYKNFDVSMVWRGSGGNKIYNGVRQQFSLLQNLGKSNVLQSAIPLGIESTQYSSDLWLEDGAYLRWQNLSIGYRFNLPNVRFINALRVSLTGQNLALITKYKGLDPELVGSNLSGGDYGTYPRTRTFSVGLNVIFK
ncbi:TonB-dependent receptor [Mucilaginibacter koreensis]